MLAVELKVLRGELQEIVDFLQSKIKSRIRAEGTRLQIDASAKQMKQLLHKFLHYKGLDAYRIEVVHPGLIEVFGPEHPRPHPSPSSRGSPPSAAATMPYEFPFSPSLPGSATRKKSKKKRSS